MRLIYRMIPAVVLTVVALLPAAVVTAQSSRQAEAHLKAAQMLEDIEGNLPAAIEAYKKLAASSDRNVAAQALLRLGGCYEKLGSADARKIYERIISEFPKEEAIMGRARERLLVLALPTSVERFAPVPIDPRVPRGWIVSPDGRFALTANGSDGLLLNDLRLGAHRVLVKNEPGQGGVGAGIWSPDGRRIAFTWRRRGGPDAGVDIRVLTLESGGVQQVATQEGVVPSAVYLLAFTTRGEIVYRTGGGSRVIFAPVAGGRSTEIALPESTPYNDGVDSLPDGSAVVVTAGERLVRIDRATGREQTLARGFPVQHPRVSPDGRLIAYISSESGEPWLRVAPLSESEISRSVKIAALPIGRNRVTRWTPDGRLMTEAGVATDNIYGLRLDDPNPSRRLERLVHSSSFASVPTISPDDRHIVFHGLGGLNVMNSDGSGERPLGATGVPVAWLSVEEMVVWTDNEGLRGLNLRTGTIRSIGFDDPLKAVAASVALSSDSFQFIAPRNELVTRRLTGDRAKFLSRRPGEEERLLFDLPRVLSWKMSPQGDRIAYVMGGPTARFTLHVRTVGRDDDKTIAEVHRSGSESWTADGRRLVYRAFSPGTPHEFRRYDVETGETTITLNSSHLENVFPPGTTWDVPRCQLASRVTFLVCQSIETTVQRLAWDGVTYEAVMARLRRQ